MSSHLQAIRAIASLASRRIAVLQSEDSPRLHDCVAQDCLCRSSLFAQEDYSTFLGPSAKRRPTESFMYSQNYGCTAKLVIFTCLYTVSARQEPCSEAGAKATNTRMGEYERRPDGCLKQEENDGVWFHDFDAILQPDRNLELQDVVHCLQSRPLRIPLVSRYSSAASTQSAET